MKIWFGRPDGKDRFSGRNFQLFSRGFRFGGCFFQFQVFRSVFSVSRTDFPVFRSVFSVFETLIFFKILKF